MKKSLILMISIIMVFTVVVGCSHSETGNRVSFIGTILENKGSHLLVEPIKDSDELRSSDKISVFIGDSTLLKSKNTQISIEDIEVGQRVEIFYNGQIAESYPAQISTCYEVRLLEYNVFTAEDENFIVKTYINKLEFKESEEISMYSTIEYIGDEDSITIWSGNPYFHYTIYDGEEYFNQGITEDLLKQTVLNKGEIYTLPFSKSGGFSGEDPKADFWKEYYSEKELKLPEGTYSFTAHTDFSLNQEQSKKVVLKNEFEVKVR